MTTKFETGNKLPVHFKNMLIIAKGDILISHHFFNLGEDVSWQISRLRCWNDSLTAVIDETDTPGMLKGTDKESAWPSSPLTVVSFSSDDNATSANTLVVPQMNGDVITFSTDTINFLLLMGKDTVTAKFQLLHDGSKIKEVTSGFEDYQVSFLTERASTSIEKGYFEWNKRFPQVLKHKILRMIVLSVSVPQNTWLLGKYLMTWLLLLKLTLETNA